MLSPIDKLDFTSTPPPPALTSTRQEMVRTLIGDSLQPGIYGLLQHTGKVLDLDENDRVLFLSADPAAGALALAREFVCNVYALAPSPEAVERGRRRIDGSDEAERVTIVYGCIDQLDLPDESFDAVISEGIFASSTNRLAAVDGMYKVLRSQGRLAITEPTAYFDLAPEELRPLFRWISLLEQARPAAVYRSLLGERGFTAFVTEDRRQDLQRAVEATRQKLMLSNLSNTTYTPNDNDDLEVSVRLARQILDLITNGVASYVLISAEKP